MIEQKEIKDDKLSSLWRNSIENLSITQNGLLPENKLALHKTRQVLEYTRSFLNNTICFNNW